MLCRDKSWVEHFSRNQSASQFPPSPHQIIILKLFCYLRAKNRGWSTCIVGENRSWVEPKKKMNNETINHHSQNQGEKQKVSTFPTKHAVATFRFVGSAIGTEVF